MSKNKEILIDSCIVFPLFLGKKARNQALMDIKRILLLGGRLQMHDSVVFELRRALKNRKISNADNDGIIEEIHSIIPSNILRIETVPNKVRRELRKIKKSETYNPDEFSNMSLVDRQLTLHSSLFNIPVFTYDNQILSILGKSKVQIDLPFPFNDEIVSKLPFDELCDLSPAMRSLIENAIQKIKNSQLKINELKRSSTHLQKQVNDLIISNEDLKEIASPNIGECATWTVIEIALGFIPIPIPTTPITSFIQSRRLKNLDREEGLNLSK